MKQTNPLPLLLLHSIIILLPLLLHSCGSTKHTSKVGNKVPAARTNNSYNTYIERYAQAALKNQKKYGIPASITLAQGLLESAAGNSKLAREANNHFGIKCHKSWQGGRTYHTDDRPNECFRVYSSPESSYDDHGKFLQQPRYRSLQNLHSTDYKGWARGLQRAGYATDKGYANKLIKIIEDYRLYLIDYNNPGRLYTYSQPPNPNQPTSQNNTITQQHKRQREFYKSYGLLYTEALEGDNLTTIAQDLGISEKKLQRYNDFPEGYPLSKGDVIYLQNKLRRAEPPHFQHTVQVGESIHDIAQRYGIRLKSLYSINNLSPDYSPQEGDLLLLR